MSKKVTVVISQGQGKNPTKRHLEEELAATLLMDPDVDVSLVPHLYDLTADHTGMLFLKSIPGEVIVLSWLYPRAARWVRPILTEIVARSAVNNLRTRDTFSSVLMPLAPYGSNFASRLGRNWNHLTRDSTSRSIKRQQATLSF